MRSLGSRSGQWTLQSHALSHCDVQSHRRVTIIEKIIVDATEGRLWNRRTFRLVRFLSGVIWNRIIIFQASDLSGLSAFDPLNFIIPPKDRLPLRLHNSVSIHGLSEFLYARRRLIAQRDRLCLPLTYNVIAVVVHRCRPQQLSCTRYIAPSGLQ